MSTPLTITREVVTREEAGFILSITDSEFETWLSADAAKDYAAGICATPQMPHFPGRPVRFDLGLLREWRRRYFLKGGEGKGGAE